MTRVKAFGILVEARGEGVAGSPESPESENQDLSTAEDTKDHRKKGTIAVIGETVSDLFVSNPACQTLCSQLLGITFALAPRLMEPGTRLGRIQRQGKSCSNKTYKDRRRIWTVRISA
jgi:hypothetical protein